MITLSKSQYKYLTSAGSVNGAGCLRWLVVIVNECAGCELVKDRTTGKLYRAITTGETVNLVPAVGKKQRRNKYQKSII